MRAILYFIFMVLCLGNLFLVSLLDEAPYRTSDMRSAYYHGCNVAKGEDCGVLADTFEEYLLFLDEGQ